MCSLPLTARPLTARCRRLSLSRVSCSAHQIRCAGSAASLNRPLNTFPPHHLQEVVTQSGQLQYASEQLLREHGFPEPTAAGGRSFPDGRKQFVVPIEEMETAFWACPAGLSMKVSN